ncbi:MAG: [protein-PII] uridylyltransferase [Syntrophobacteraceae bacterium]
MALRPNLPQKLKELRDNFARECRTDVPGLLAARTYSSNFHDALQKAFSEDAAAQEGWALVAVGGFGRGELSFSSDLDLLFLYKKRLPHFLQELVRELVYGLWDSGFEVGHATGSLSSVRKMVQEDFTILTNYLETSLIAGDEELFRAWKESFLKSFGTQSRRRFLHDLSEYRGRRLSQFRESPYLLEPHVKDGVGGLRDLHTIRWAGIVFLQDPSLGAMVRKEWLTESEGLWLDQAYDFLWRVRLQLHQLTGRRKDQLLFPEQEKIAERMGCMDGTEGSAVEAFMRLYYRHTSRIRRTTSFFLERVEEARKRFRGFHLRKRILPGPFLLEGKHLHFMEPDWIKKDPALLMRFFWQAAQSKAHFHHQAGKIIRENLGEFRERERRNPEVLKQFFNILLDPEHSFTVLKVMLETAFLQTFIPEFAGVRYRVQNDVYHVYTVDEHLLRTVLELHAIERGEAEPVLPQDTTIDPGHRRILYLAALLHDIGKGKGKNHAAQGADMARVIAERMQLDPGETSLLCFLIEHHLMLAETALKRDLMDEKPIAQCAVEIKDRERLLLLYLLTVADSRATGTSAWNAWKASLLRQLFFKVDRLLLREDLEPEDMQVKTAGVHGRVMELLPDALEAERVSQWMERLPFRYLLSQSPSAILQHFGMEKELARRSVCLKAEPAEGEMWQITVVTRDRPGLFALITGALWARGLNILSADIYTREPGVACDILIVDKIPDPLRHEEMWSRLETDLVRSLDDASYLEQILESRRRPSILQPKSVPRKDDKVIIDEDASDFYTLIEIYTWDRPGVLHSITNALYHLGLTIQLAKISTPGAQVVDIFYVTDLSGEKLMDYDRHQEVREKLLECLTAVC